VDSHRLATHLAALDEIVADVIATRNRSDVEPRSGLVPV
jgi:hypothetical protein